ncbi:hypothetical protein PQX77_008820 [Marasmius sp. AFHP31]|nr:hypothetical protein PQX77_008820 [Marasmius sp. AFHP31]
MSICYPLSQNRVLIDTETPYRRGPDSQLTSRVPQNPGDMSVKDPELSHFHCLDYMIFQQADLVVGPSLIGIFVNLLLFGVVLSQAWAYITGFPKSVTSSQQRSNVNPVFDAQMLTVSRLRDPLWLKIFTVVLLGVDAFGTIVMLCWIYNTLVVKFADMESLMMLNWMASIVPFITVRQSGVASNHAKLVVDLSFGLAQSIMSFMTQSYFIRRLASFTQSFYVPAVLALLSVASSAAGVALFVLFIMHRNSDYLTIGGIHLIRILTKVWLIPTVLVDTGIAGALVWHLHKSRTGLAHTDVLINMIIRVTIPTGLVTAVAAIVELILFLALEGKSSAYIGLAIALYQLYPLTMLVNLNVRRNYRNLNSTEVISRGDLSFRVTVQEQDESRSGDVSSGQ